MSDETRQLAAAMVAQRLESLRRAGLTHLGTPPADFEPLPGTAVAEVATETESPQPAAPIAPVPLPSADSPAAPQVPAANLFAAEDRPPDLPDDERRAVLAVIQREVAACTRCPELVANRTQTVFGVGNIRPRLVFCGEAPGADEDRLGEPFVGAAGQLLNKIIAACTLKREEVYILNTLKCRPPGNRNPLPSEVVNCRGYLDRQLDILRPEYICCLGGVAAQTLLETDQSVGKMRGKFHEYRGIPVAVTYHPAYLLRTPTAKRATWDDMKMLMQAMGIDWEQSRG